MNVSSIPLANGIARFPPAFEESPWNYGAALFSLTLISAVSLGIVVGYVLEARRRREVNRLVQNRVPLPVHSMLSPIGLHRLIASGLLLTILFGALPDVLVMLAWGEASDRTMVTLFQIDKAFDALTLLPFLGSVFVSLKAAQIVDHRLGLEPMAINLRPTWGMVREKLKMIALVLIIAVGVTLYKAGVA